MPHALLALTLAAVLDHAADYVARFEHELSAIVAEEQYHQAWTHLPAWLSAIGEPTRDVRSDLLLVRGVENEWVQYRDAFEVNGESVRDRSDRVTVLLRKGTPVARAQLAEIAEASARYNLGDITRTVNTPLLALKFLERDNQRRFSFRLARNRIPDTIVREREVPGVFRTSIEAWVIEYEERKHPTIVREHEGGGKDVPAHGRFWIEADTGRVFMSEIIAENKDVRGTIDVSYRSEPIRGLLVPVEMREWYEGKHTGSKIETVARYGNFRDVQE